MIRKSEGTLAIHKRDMPPVAPRRLDALPNGSIDPDARSTVPPSCREIGQLQGKVNELLNSFIKYDEQMHQIQQKHKARGSFLKTECHPKILDELTTIGVKSIDTMTRPCRSIHGQFECYDLDSMSIISDLTDAPTSEFANLSVVNILVQDMSIAQHTSSTNDLSTRASSHMHKDSLTRRPATKSLDRALSNAAIPQRRGSIRL
jgi:hypothetical protein